MDRAAHPFFLIGIAWMILLCRLTALTFVWMW
jgi:hypothetical protein